MKLLLDTHTFIWFITDDLKLISTAKAAIEDESNEKFDKPLYFRLNRLSCQAFPMPFSTPLPTNPMPRPITSVST